MLSAVLIVRNEAACIASCIASLAGVDEIVLCDTGSTDDTADIAAAAALAIGAPVTFTNTAWQDDFSRARNAALNAANGGWILSIDADERLATGALKLLMDAIAEAKGRTLAVNLIAKMTGHTHRAIRCFRRGLKWVGAIHEVPECDDGEGCAASIIYGSSPARALDPDRNLRILSRLVALQPEHARSLYYLAREYWYRKDFEAAGPLFHRCTKSSKFPAEKADAHLYLARILWDMKREADARHECMNAIAINPNFREALRFLAEMSLPDNAAAWNRFAECATGAGVLFNRCPVQESD